MAALNLEIRQYLALVRHRPKFVVGLILVFAVAAICEALGYTTWLVGAPDTNMRELVIGFGDAFIIAFVIALLADPVAQRRFATDWGREIFWAIFNRDAPEDFRKALQRLAEPRVFVSHCTYELEFSEPGGDGPADHVLVDWRILLTGEVLDRNGFLPKEKVFVVSGHDGHYSQYTDWVFNGRVFDTCQLRHRNAVQEEKDGRTSLDQEKLTCGLPLVRYKDQYQAQRRLTTTRWRSDYLPLFQPQMVIHQEVIVRGTALASLEFSAVQLGVGALTPVPDDDSRLCFQASSVAFPGQAILFSWRPKATTAALS
jgi:hypothetical protein